MAEGLNENVDTHKGKGKIKAECAVCEEAVNKATENTEGTHYYNTMTCVTRGRFDSGGGWVNVSPPAEFFFIPGENSTI